MTMAALAAAVSAAQAPASPAVPDGWRELPGYVDLFAPVHHHDRYRAFVSSRSLDQIVREIALSDAFLHPPGAWVPESLSGLDAFGESGPYNRPRLAMLYAGTPVRVARGPRLDDGRVVESWTLRSPYPDPKFGKLEQGTLLIVAALPRSE